MSFAEILTPILAFIGGGGLVGVFTIRSSRKKADVEVKVSEIEAIHLTVERVYQPLIDRQNERIKELEKEVSSLRTQLSDERASHQRELDLMNKRILAISKAIGLKVETQIRDEKGRYVAKQEEDN